MTKTPEIPVLPADRVDRMRQQVLAEISADARHSKAERRKLIGRGALGGAAAAVVISIAALGINNMAVQPMADDYRGAADSAATEPDSAVVGAEPGLATDIAKSQSTREDAATPEFVSTSIVTGSMSVLVDDAEKAIGQIAKFAAAHGGQIDNESLIGGGNDQYGRATVRVPADQVGALRTELGRIGKVESVEVNRVDASAQVADVQARIDSLTASIKRLRQIVAESATTKDLLDAEAQLSARQADLESLQAQRRVLLDQTSLASIEVSVHEQTSAASVEPSGFFGGLTRGWNALVAATNSVVTFTGMAVPWLLPLGAVFGAGLLIWRRIRK